MSAPAEELERQTARLRPTAKRLVVLWLVAAGVCGLGLRFVFPGYLDPFIPVHIDHYNYIGAHAEGYGLGRYFLYYPRPVAYLLIDLCGRLGVHWLFAPLFVLAWTNAALLVLLVERVAKLRIAWPCFVFFLVLAYSNPEFYWNLKEDPFSVFALTFLLSIFHAWQSYAETGKRVYLAAIVVLALLFSLTKESYFVALALFLLIQSVADVRRRRATVALLMVSAAFMGFSLFRSAQVWVLFHSKPEPADPYYTSLMPRSVWHGFLKIGKYLAVPVVGGSVVAALVRAAQTDRCIFLTSLGSVLLGAAALAPNATLPNHLEAQYAFLGAYFFLAPLLFADRLIPARRSWQLGLVLTGVAIYALALVEYRRPAGEVAGWLRQQEEIARRMLPALERIKRETNPGQTSLILGATMFYDPFLAPQFILSEFGPHRYWTVVVPDQIAEQEKYTTQLLHASNPARVAWYDHLFVFQPDGRLVAEIRRPDPAAIDEQLRRVP